MRIAYLVVWLALVAPATAAAQAPPPDERAAAQAFADAAKKFERASEAIDAEDDSWIKPCERAFERVPERRSLDAVMLLLDHSFRRVLDELKTPMRTFRSELAIVPTADPVLISGRAAVRRMGRVLDTIPAPGRFCREFRAWRRAGYPPSALRAAERTLELVGRSLSPGILRKLEATALRMRELGVSRRDAEAFGGHGGW